MSDVLLPGAAPEEGLNVLRAAVRSGAVVVDLVLAGNTTWRIVEDEQVVAHVDGYDNAVAVATKLAQALAHAATKYEAAEADRAKARQEAAAPVPEKPKEK